MEQTNRNPWHRTDPWADLNKRDGGLPPVQITDKTDESITVFLRSISDAEDFIADLEAVPSRSGYRTTLTPNVLLVSDSRASGMRGVSVTVCSTDERRLDFEISSYIKARSAL